VAFEQPGPFAFAVACWQVAGYPEAFDCRVPFADLLAVPSQAAFAQKQTNSLTLTVKPRSLYMFCGAE